MLYYIYITLFLFLFTFFFFNDTATTEIYTLSLHDALPIYAQISCTQIPLKRPMIFYEKKRLWSYWAFRQLLRLQRSEEHTSELQSQSNLVCRLLLEKKKKKYHTCVNTKEKYLSCYPVYCVL